jgi:hypothetical protein
MFDRSGRMISPAFCVQRKMQRLASSVCEDGEFELMQMLGIADDLDFRNLSVREGEAEHAEDASARSDDESHRAIDKRRLCGTCATSGGDCASGPVLWAANLSQASTGWATWRAALALTEAVTRISDRADPVPDAIWDEAARHYDEPELAILVLSIAMINLWNQINVTTRQVAGEWRKSAQGQSWSEQTSGENWQEHAAAS